MTPKAQEKFLVPFAEEILNTLEQCLDFMPSNAPRNKIVLSGHTGCGKSTLLSELKQKIDDRYFLVFFSIADFVPPFELSHTILLFVMFLQLLRSLRRSKNENYKLDSSTEATFLEWLADLSGVSLQKPIGFSNKRREVEKEEWFLDGLIQELKTSGFRDLINTYFNTRISDLTNRLDQLTDHINQAVVGQPLLFIIDDLDKIDLAVARQLFQENIKSFFQIHAPAIFTIPITALSDIGTNSEIRRECYKLISMPTLKLLAKEERRNPKAVLLTDPRQKLEDVLRKRMDLELFDAESKALDALILASGGVIQELVRLAHECVFTCSLTLRQYQIDQEVEVKIDLEVLQQVKAKTWRDMSLALRSEAKEVLRYIYVHSEPPNVAQEDFLMLLKGIYVIEYTNRDLWYDLHPIVAEGLNLTGQ
jgi:nucleoside-triphosphatase THEP1